MCKYKLTFLCIIHVSSICGCFKNVVGIKILIKLVFNSLRFRNQGINENPFLNKLLMTFSPQEVTAVKIVLDRDNI